MQKLQDAHQEEMTITKVESFALNPHIDYDKVSSVIAQVESQFSRPGEDALIHTPAIPSEEERLACVRDANPHAFDTMTDVDKIGHQHISSNGNWAKPVEANKSAPKTLVWEDDSVNIKAPVLNGNAKPLPPIHDDFLAFLIEKNPKSFGWVVEPSFFTNFQCNLGTFKEKEPFIFWIAPCLIQTVKTANAGGFQRSETRSNKMHPHLFLIKLLEIKEGDAEADPFIEIINDPNYLKLRESLEERGIEFLYDYNPSRLWLNGLQDRLKKK